MPRVDRTTCFRCGKRKEPSKFIDGTGNNYCRACGVVPCVRCGEFKPVSEFAEGQQGSWFCRACGIPVCESCGSRWSGWALRHPTLERTCYDCVLQPLSKHERAALEREEQDYRRQVKAGHPPEYPESSVATARSAALLGVSPRRYTESSEAYGLATLLWYPAYLLSAVFVLAFAIWQGLTASSFEPLSIVATVLLLGGWWLFWTRIVATSETYQDLSTRSRLTIFLGGMFPPLSGLLLPVLTYMLVRILVPASWP